MAARLWASMAQHSNDERTKYIAGVLAVSERAVRGWTKDVRKAETDALKAEAVDRWLNCETQREIAAEAKSVGRSALPR